METPEAKGMIKHGVYLRPCKKCGWVIRPLITGIVHRILAERTVIYDSVEKKNQTNFKTEEEV